MAGPAGPADFKNCFSCTGAEQMLCNILTLHPFFFIFPGNNSFLISLVPSNILLIRESRNIFNRQFARISHSSVNLNRVISNLSSDSEQTFDYCRIPVDIFFKIVIYRSPVHNASIEYKSIAILLA